MSNPIQDDQLQHIEDQTTANRMYDRIFLKEKNSKPIIHQEETIWTEISEIGLYVQVVASI